MTIYAEPRFLAAGDSGLVVEFGDEVDPAVNARVLALDARLAERPIDGVVETVATYRSLMVYYDPLRLAFDALEAAVRERLDGLGDAAPKGRRWTFPVCYGGEFGEDLPFVAKTHGLSVESAVERFAAAPYRVYMIGFSPGFAYLGGLDAALHTTRRTHPRPRVPAGSVALGGIQAAIMSVAGPSGWHLLGRTPERLFNLERDPVFLVAVGDSIRFEAVDEPTWRALETRAEAGEVVARVE